MKIHILCILALCALPSVLAISCYLCVPDLQAGSMCTSNVTNITDCDTLDGAPKGTYDACMKTSLVMSMGGKVYPMNQMTCMIKSMCDSATKQACNQSLPAGVTMDKCESNCCYTDKCNGLDAGISPTNAATASVSMSVPATPSKAPQTPSGPTSHACAHLASFVVVGVTMIISGFFKH